MIHNKVIEIKIGIGVKFIKSENIVFIKTSKRHTTFFLSNNESLDVYHTIKCLSQLLPKPEFCRCHNSYIINCRFIKALDYTRCRVILDGYDEISFSRKYKDLIIRELKEFIELS